MYQNIQSHCLHCEEPLIGRADKKYCDSSCKARYHHANKAAQEPIGLPPLSTPVPALARFLLDCPAHVALCDWEDTSKTAPQNELYNRVRAYYEVSDVFHTAYADIVHSFLTGLYDNFTYAEYGGWQREVERTARNYAQHPALLTPGHLAQHRLADLRLICSYVQAVGTQAQIREQNASVKYLEPCCQNQHLSARQLQNIWANLLGVA